MKDTKERVKESKKNEKYIISIMYDASDKSIVLSEIKKLECEILEQPDSKNHSDTWCSSIQMLKK